MGPEKHTFGSSRISEYGVDGATVLRSFFNPEMLSREVDETLARGRRPGARTNTGAAGNAFEYVPMMCEQKAFSLQMIDALVDPAAELLGRDALPVRAKGTRYVGTTSWHRDLELDMASVGFACYLEPLDASTGALRIVKGSHSATPAHPLEGIPDPHHVDHGDVMETRPGDVIALDEHLWHSSSGGGTRRQWRIDFIGDPQSADEEDVARRYMEQIFQEGWDGGYDVDRYPSFGKFLQDQDLPWLDRLRELGALDLSEREEDYVRSRRVSGCD